MQTPRELVDCLLRKKRAERVGMHDFYWADALRQWVKEGYPADAEGNPAATAEQFKPDMVGVGGWFDILPIRGFSEIVQETDEWKVVRNGAGASLKWWKNKSGTPEHMDFRMTSRETWEKDYRPHLLQLDRQRLDIPATAKELNRWRQAGVWTYYGHLFVWENMRQSMGDVCLYESLLLDPAWIHDYCRVHTDFYKMHYKVLLEEAGAPDGMWLFEDLGYCNGLFCSPRTYAELIFPYYREIVDFFHSYDMPVVMHSCGRVTDAMPMIIEAGFDALNPMEVKAGCDIFKYAQQYGDRLAFIGGLDVRVLETGDRDLIRREVTGLVEGMKRRGARYLFGSDHSITTGVKYADYQYALDVYRDHMMY